MPVKYQIVQSLLWLIFWFSISVYVWIPFSFFLCCHCDTEDITCTTLHISDKKKRIFLNYMGFVSIFNFWVVSITLINQLHNNNDTKTQRTTWHHSICMRKKNPCIVRMSGSYQLISDYCIPVYLYEQHQHCLLAICIISIIIVKRVHFFWRLFKEERSSWRSPVNYMVKSQIIQRCSGITRGRVLYVHFVHKDFRSSVICICLQTVSWRFLLNRRKKYS